MAPVGIFDGIQIISKMAAINLTITAYASAATRTSLVFTAIFSAIYLKEKITKRLAPTMIIAAGLILIALA